MELKALMNIITFRHCTNHCCSKLSGFIYDSLCLHPYNATVFRRFLTTVSTNDAMMGWISSSPGFVLLLKRMDHEVFSHEYAFDWPVDLHRYCMHTVAC